MKKNIKKENPLIKEKKVNFKNTSFSSDEDENVIKKFIIIVLVIAVLAFGVYLLTDLINKKDDNTEEAVTKGVINYNRLSIGMLLNRPYDDYYVMLYDEKDPEAVKYSTLLTNYMNKSKDENPKKIYFCDLGNVLNAAYYNVGEDDISNPNAKSINELDLGKLTLLEIKNGQISRYIEDYNQIRDELK